MVKTLRVTCDRCHRNTYLTEFQNWIVDRLKDESVPEIVVMNHNFKRIVTLCPTCVRSFKSFMTDFEVRG